MPREQILSEIQRAAEVGAAAARQRAMEEGARLRAAAEADAAKRRNELIEGARRGAEHERRRLLLEAHRRALHRSVEERARGLEGARRQLATMREANAYAERLKKLAREAEEILLSVSKGQSRPVPFSTGTPGASTGSARTGLASSALRGALVILDPREIGLVSAGFAEGDDA